MTYSTRQPSLRKAAARAPVVDMVDQPLDLERFTWPKIQYAEVVIPVGGTAHIDQEGYKLSKTMLVDYIWIGEETLSTGGPAAGNHTIFLDHINAWWWITSRSETTKRRVMPLLFHNYAEAKRWNIFETQMPVLPVGLPFTGNVSWKFLRPWRMIPGSGLVIDYNYIGALGVPPIDVVLYGIGVESKHRRTFETQLPLIDVGVTQVPSSWTESEFIMNQTNEPYDIDRIVFNTQGITPPAVPPLNGIVNWWGNVAGVNDIRQMHQLYYTLRPTVGEPFSEVPVPLIAYGPDIQPYRTATYKPSGGSLLIEGGSTIGWEIQNPAAGATPVRVQVAMIGRVEPSGF